MEWIKIIDKKPKPYQRILIHTNTGFIGTASYNFIDDGYG